LSGPAVDLCKAFLAKVDKVGFTLSGMLLLIGNGIGQFRLQRKITMFFGQTANSLRLIGR
jgi:hypothetical protein